MELELIKWAVLGVLSALWWFLRNLITKGQEDIKILRDDIDMIKKEYLHKDDFKDFKVELRSMFEELRKDIRALNEKT